MPVKRSSYGGRHGGRGSPAGRMLRPLGLLLLVSASLCGTLALLSWKSEVFSIASVAVTPAQPKDLRLAQGAAGSLLLSEDQEEPSGGGDMVAGEGDAVAGGEAGAVHEHSSEAGSSESAGAGGAASRQRSRSRSRSQRQRASSGSARGSSSAAGGSGGGPAPSNSRRHRREKERIDQNAADFGKISREIIAQLAIPKTAPYKHKFPDGTRLVVNKQNPNNRLAHSQQEKSASNLPDADITQRWGSCAVVGNSGLSLFNDKQGEAIDKHDVVIRFNDGPTAGFEKYVGTKTSFRFINNNWSRVYTRRQPRGCSEDALMLFGNGAVRFLHALAAKFGPGGNKQVYFMAPEFALNARGTYKKAYAVMDESGYMRVKGRNSPPTGIEGVFFGLEVCDTVDLFGFQIANDPKIKYHYHNEVKGVEAAHSFGFQYEFLKVLMSGGFIQVCLPETESGSCLTGIAEKREEETEGE